jgi:hypothetical protein
MLPAYWPQSSGPDPFVHRSRYNPRMTRSATYIDIGYASAREFWDEIVLASAGRFKTDPTRAHAMAVAIYVSHFLDWVFHEKYPGQDTRNNQAYADFKAQHHGACPELIWLQDLADVAKHRGLGRDGVSLKQLAGSGAHQEGTITDVLGSRTEISEVPLELELADGTRHRFSEVVAHAIEYWRANR